MRNTPNRIKQKKLLKSVCVTISVVFGIATFRTKANSAPVKPMKEANTGGAPYVMSAEWVKINSDLDENPNAGLGTRIYPDKLTPADSTSRNTVTVTAKISPALEGIKVHFKSFDVDDPSADFNSDQPEVVTGVLDNFWVDRGDTKSGTKGGDNRSGDEAGEVAKEGKFPTGNNEGEALTDANGVATLIFTVGMQPGDNYRVAASVNKAGLDSLNNDNVPSNNDGTLTISPGTGITPLLTVWRRLHIERDSMRAIQGNENSVECFITEISAASDSNQNATLNVDLEEDTQVRDNLGHPDHSDNFDSAGKTPRKAGNGRFESGYVSIGSGASVKKTNNLWGSGIHTIRTGVNKKFDIPFTLTSSSPNTASVSGQVIGLASDGINSVLTVNLSDDVTMAPHSFSSIADVTSSVNVAGEQFGVTDNTASSITLSTGDAKLTCVLHDDDLDTILPYTPHINDETVERFSHAYVTPVADGAGAATNDNVDVPFARNLSNLYAAFEGGHIQSKSVRSNSYWVAAISVCFQSATTADASSSNRSDADPRSETPMGGQASLGDGFALWMEEEREFGDLVLNDQGKVTEIKHEGQLFGHELSHLFNCPDRYAGNFASVPCPVPGACGLMENQSAPNKYLVPADLAIIRSCRKP